MLLSGLQFQFRYSAEQSHIPCCCHASCSFVKINVYESMGLSTADNDSHPVTVSPISQSSSYTGKDIYRLPQYAHRVRPAQHKIPKLTASKG